MATNAGNVALAVRQQVETETTTTPLLTFDAAVPDPGGGPSDGHLVVFAGP